MKMSDHELISTIQQAVSEAESYVSKINKINYKLNQAYNCEFNEDFPYNQDASNVISTDCFDVVESDMPSLARVFLSDAPVIHFKAIRDNKEEIAEAEEKTKYAHWIISSQPDSYRVRYNWLKDAEINKFGMVKYFIEETEEVDEIVKEGLSELEVAQVVETLAAGKNGIVEVEPVEHEMTGDGLFNVTFRVLVRKKEIHICNVPPESAIISPNATSKHDAEIIGDRISKTRGQLLAEGYKKELIDKLPTQTNTTDLVKYARDKINSDDNNNDIASWSNQLVEIKDIYVLVDYDNDGIAERRHIMISGNHIIVNEPFNHVPYALMSSYLVPHSLVGKSRVEVAYPVQKQKTALKRAINDNAFMVSNPRNVVHEAVDYDDLLTVRENGIIRIDDPNILPQNAIYPLTVPYIGDRLLQVVQSVDQDRAQSLGTLLASQGLDADSIEKETATRFNGIRDDGQAKIELVARNYAETGFKDLYEGIIWLASNYQDAETEIRVLGKELSVNPQSWKYTHYTRAGVGLGAGDNERLIDAYQGLYALQTQLKQQGSLLVDDDKLYNTIKGILKGLGLHEQGKFINNPQEPNELLKAQNEQLNALVLQLQQQLQQVQNPLAEAEQVKQQAFLIKAKADAELKAAELAEKQRQFEAKMQAEKDKQINELAMKLTELEAKYNQQLNQEYRTNKGDASV
jgi:hypothetical protein